MNKHGQSLIIFVLMLPIIVFFIAYFISLSLISLENNRLKEIVKDNIEIVVNKDIRDIEKIEDVIENNNLNATVTINNDDIKITARSNKKIVFNNIFKIKENDIEISFCANYQTKRIERC